MQSNKLMMSQIWHVHFNKSTPVASGLGWFHGICWVFSASGLKCVRKDSQRAHDFLVGPMGPQLGHNGDKRCAVRQNVPGGGRFYDTRLRRAYVAYARVLKRWP